MRPLVLLANQPIDRFYRGGPRISTFRAGLPISSDVGDDRVPEDWVGSITSVRGETTAGKSMVLDGIQLAEAIANDPELWLGPDHVKSFGVDTMLLVKLLDAGQRLPVHAHPDAAFAQIHLGARHGKAEAWYVLTPGPIFLGLRRPIPLPELRELVDRQGVEALLDAMHQINLQPHDSVFVPPGVLHAIGEGILLVEVQEPEDLSILLEWRDFSLDGSIDGHLGIGFDVALTAVESRARTLADIEALIIRADALGYNEGNGNLNCLPAASNRYFRLHRIEVRFAVPIAAGFAVLIVIDGEIRIAAADGSKTDTVAGATVLVPHAAGPLTLTGNGTVLVARPPEPEVVI